MTDLHNDVIIKMCAWRFARYIRRSAAAGVTELFVSVWTTKMRNPMRRIRRYRARIDRVAAQNPSIKLHLHIEDAWFVNDGNIDRLLSYKPYSVGLTWNHENPLAGGASALGRLTPLGARVATKLCDNGVYVDLAHLNRKSFFDVMAIIRASGQRPLCTHTCFNEMCPHARNLTRGQVRAIVDAGGTIGLTLVKKFLSPAKATVADLYRHIDYFKRNFPHGNLGLGTDFFGGILVINDYRKLDEVYRRIEKS